MANSTRIVPTARGPIEVLSIGEGPAVLALHGGMGGHDQGWLLARALDLSGMRVLAVSRPGYLGTPLTSGQSPEAQADLYAALLETLGIAHTLVVAVSAGGTSALQFAARHPDRVRGIVLVSAATGTLEAPPDLHRRMPLIKLFANLPLLASLQAWRRRRAPERTASRSISDPALRAKTLAHPVAGPMLAQMQVLTFEHLARRLPGTLNDISTLAALPALPIAVPRQPVLAIHGTADRIAPFAQARALADASSRVELAAIDGGEHVCLFTHLDEVRATVRRFLARLPA